VADDYDDIRALLLATRPRCASLGYPLDVRARVAVFANAQLSLGYNQSLIAKKVGVSRQSLQGWRNSVGALAPVAVEVIDDAPRSLVATSCEEREPVRANRMGGVGSVEPLRFTLVSPRGFRVEGLDLGSAFELLGRLG